MNKVGLLEYADLLKEWDVDSQIIKIYVQQTNILKHFLKTEELLEVERSVIRDYESFYSKKDEVEGQYTYAWMCEPYLDIQELGASEIWEGWIIGFLRFGMDDLDNRKKWHLESTCAACLLIVSYAESIQAGKVQRNDAFIRAAVMQDLAFLLSDAAFLGGSVHEIEKQKVKRKRRKGAVESAAKSFKARFRNEVVSPEYQKILKKGLQWGDKADFIRKMVQAYADFFDEAVNNGAALSERDEFITEETIKRWISEIDNKMKSSVSNDKAS